MKRWMDDVDHDDEEGKIYYTPVELYLDVAMQHMCRMDIIEAFKDLIDEVLNVVDIQRLLAIDDTMKIGVH